MPLRTSKKLKPDQKSSDFPSLSAVNRVGAAHSSKGMITLAVFNTNPVPNSAFNEIPDSRNLITQRWKIHLKSPILRADKF